MEIIKNCSYYKDYEVKKLLKEADCDTLKGCITSINMHWCSQCPDYGYKCWTPAEAWALEEKYEIIFTNGEE